MSKRVCFLFFLACLAVFQGPLLAAGAADSVSVSEPYIRAVPPGLPNSASYMVLTNNGDRDLVLKGASSPAAKVVELHTHLMENGMMKMRQVEKIDLPAGQTVALQPGGYHVMMIGLQQQLVPGEQIDLTLQFEDGSELAVKAPVVKLQMKMTKGGMNHNMGGMQHK